MSKKCEIHKLSDEQTEKVFGGVGNGYGAAICDRCGNYGAYPVDGGGYLCLACMKKATSGIGEK